MFFLARVKGTEENCVAKIHANAKSSQDASISLKDTNRRCVFNTLLNTHCLAATVWKLRALFKCVILLFGVPQKNECWNLVCQGNTDGNGSYTSCGLVYNLSCICKLMGGERTLPLQTHTDSQSG